jgi:hypothetical protein
MESTKLCPAASFLAIAAVICDMGAVKFSDPKSRFFNESWKCKSSFLVLREVESRIRNPAF